MDSFRGQVALITGASDGIGRGLALRLAAEGARLVLGSRNIEKLRRVAGECEAQGGQAIAVPADVGRRDDCRKLVETAVETCGALHLLVNNAGVSMYARFSAVRDLGMLEHILRVNFLGAMYCTGYALPDLRRARGRVVAVSSLAGKMPGPGGTAYTASKYALRGFFDSLRTELKVEGVSVTVAYPAFVRTEIYKRFLDAEGSFGPDRSGRVPRWATMSVDRCAARILEAARRRRAEVPRTLLDGMLLAANRYLPWLVDLFWRRTLAMDFPGESAGATSNTDNPPPLHPIMDAPPADRA
jgi:short-subunit dehydrogenase